MGQSMRYKDTHNTVNTSYLLGTGQPEFGLKTLKVAPCIAHPTALHILLEGVGTPKSLVFSSLLGMDGRVSAWNLLYQQSSPVTSVFASENSLQTMKITPDRPSHDGWRQLWQVRSTGITVVTYLTRTTGEIFSGQDV